MHEDIIEAPPGDTPVDLAIWLSPLQTWRSVYGNGFCEEAMRVCVERLTGLGIDAESLERAGDTVLVRGFDPRTMADTVLPGNQARHGWMHALESALVRDPVVDGARQAYLRAEVQALGCVSLTGLHEIRGKGHATAGVQDMAVRRMHPRLIKAYQADMQLAGRLLDDLRLGHLALAFQPVTLLDPAGMAGGGSGAGAGRTLYHECLLRRSVFSAYDNYAVPHAIEALERLGLAARLDRSVLWSMIGALEMKTGHSLGCNLSAASFCDDAWWDGVFDYLEDRPEIAQRLVLEITETGAFPCEKAALGLVRHLQILGVRVALDDIVPRRGGLDILGKLRANIVKIDKSVLDQSLQARPSARMMQGLVSLCADRGACVIVEGIESAQGLEAVALAGAHGAQGFFIARPSLHGLLDQVVRVEDVLEVLEATEVQDGDELDMALSWSGMERMSALVAASTVSGGAEVSAAETGMGTGFFLQARA